MKEYICNSKLKTILDGYNGVQKVNGKFINDEVGKSRPKLKDILKWQLSSNVERKHNKQSTYVPELIIEENYFDNTIDKIVWLGHASFLLTIGGRNILIDPIFKNVSIIKRRTKLPFMINEINKIDYILISHAHMDHLDKFSVKVVVEQNPYAKIFCGLGTADLIKKWGIKNEIIEAGWWQQFPTNDDIEIFFLPSQHWSNRNLKDRNIRLWGSFIIQNKDSSVYFMGDSAYGGHFAKIGKLFPRIDYAIMGVGAYLPRNIMQSSHLNPEESYQAYKDLGADKMIPMHYGTFILSDEPITEPIKFTRELFVEEKDRLLDLAVGKLFELK
ncbi:MAG: MBL fold metallo-hydrolase [Burkholderiales bacterium]|nr:MBL fold metallo-hydrolase [Burkholderiales bacterium]